MSNPATDRADPPAGTAAQPAARSGRLVGNLGELVMMILVAAGLLSLVLTTTSLAASDNPGPRVFFGVDVPGTDSVTAVQRIAGQRPTVASIFVKLDSTTFSTGRLTAMAKAGVTPFITIEPWSYKDRWGMADLQQYSLESIASGRWDSSFRRIAATLKASGHPAYVRFAHEMNGWWYPWAAGTNGNSAPEYVAAWRHVVSLLRADGGGKLSYVWSPNALTGDRRETPLAASYPGDAWVDDVGMTAYGHGSDAATTFGATYRALTALTAKPIILSETGASGPAKARWISTFGRFVVTHPRIVGFVWFQTDTSGGASGDYRFDQTAADADGFRSALKIIRSG